MITINRIIIKINVNSIKLRDVNRQNSKEKSSSVNTKINKSKAKTNKSLAQSDSKNEDIFYDDLNRIDDLQDSGKRVVVALYNSDRSENIIKRNANENNDHFESIIFSIFEDPRDDLIYDIELDGANIKVIS